MEYAQCMRHVLAAVNSSDLVALLEQTRLTSEEQVGHADSEAAGQFTKYVLIFLDTLEVLVSWNSTFGTAKCPVIEVSSFRGVMIRGIYRVCVCTAGDDCTTMFVVYTRRSQFTPPPYHLPPELDSKLDRLGQLIHSRRELSTVLSREMGFLNASVHGYMSEVVRLAHAEKQILQNLDSLLHSLNVSLL